MGLLISSKYLKKGLTDAPSKNVETKSISSSEYLSVEARVIQGGGRPSYYLGSYGVQFNTNGGGVYTASIPSRYASTFITGFSVTIGCGCGGKKKTILQII